MHCSGDEDKDLLYERRDDRAWGMVGGDRGSLQGIEVYHNPKFGSRGFSRTDPSNKRSGLGRQKNCEEGSKSRGSSSHTNDSPFAISASLAFLTLVMVV